MKRTKDARKNAILAFKGERLTGEIPKTKIPQYKNLKEFGTALYHFSEDVRVLELQNEALKEKVKKYNDLEAQVAHLTSLLAINGVDPHKAWPDKLLVQSGMISKE